MSTQLSLTFPALPPRPPVAHVPAHNPRRAPQLSRACAALLELLADGQPHPWHALLAAGGARYGARIGELRSAGHVVLGPLAWRRPDGSREDRRQPLSATGDECYRLVVRG